VKVLRGMDDKVISERSFMAMQPWKSKIEILEMGEAD
jgi:hypothetical protein